MYSYGPPHMAGQKQDDLLEHTYSSYVMIRDVALKICQSWWTIGRSGERGSGISVPVLMMIRKIYKIVNNNDKTSHSLHTFTRKPSRLGLLNTPSGPWQRNKIIPHPPNVLDIITNNQTVRLLFWNFENMEYPFIASFPVPRWAWVVEAV